MQGTAATATSKRFVNVATRRLRLVLENRGVGGALSTQTAEMVTATPPGLADFYLVMTGLNDARLYGSRSTALDDYGAALTKIFDAFIAANPGGLVVSVAQPHLRDYSQHAPYDRAGDELIDAYNARLAEIGGRYPRVKVATTQRWNKRIMLAADTVHPNDLGHRELSRAVCRSVSR